MTQEQKKELKAGIEKRIAEMDALGHDFAKIGLRGLAPK